MRVWVVFTSFIMHRTGTALPDDNERTLVTTAPWSRGRDVLFLLCLYIKILFEIRLFPRTGTEIPI